MIGEPKNMLGCAEVKVPAAREICDQLADIVGFAENLTERMNRKLDPIMEGERPANACAPQPIREFPALFSEYRGQLGRLHSLLYAIEDMLNRVEV